MNNHQNGEVHKTHKKLSKWKTIKKSVADHDDGFTRLVDNSKRHQHRPKSLHIKCQSSAKSFTDELDSSNFFNKSSIHSEMEDYYESSSTSSDGSSHILKQVIASYNTRVGSTVEYTKTEGHVCCDVATLNSEPTKAILMNNYQIMIYDMISGFKGEVLQIENHHCCSDNNKGRFTISSDD